MMNTIDNDLAEEYLSECCEQVRTIQTALLELQGCGTDMDAALLDRVFRALYSVKKAASFLDLVKTRELAGETQNVLARIRAGELPPTPDRIGVLLKAANKMRILIQNPGESDQSDTTEIMAALTGLSAVQQPFDKQGCHCAADPEHHQSRNFRVLLVEDDFASRLLLQTFLSRYGECHVAVNGKEAVEAFRTSLARRQRYDLICMDIMMPEMDGREAVRQVRALEAQQGILWEQSVKIFMTTAVDDIGEVFRCFNELCDAYLVKPIDLGKLLEKLKSYQLVE